MAFRTFPTQPASPATRQREALKAKVLEVVSSEPRSTRRIAADLGYKGSPPEITSALYALQYEGKIERSQLDDEPSKWERT